MRSTIFFLSTLQVLMSFLFYRFAGLFFFLDERSEIYPVSKLVSQGGDEDALITIGCFLFFVLSVFNLARFKLKLRGFDIAATLLILFVQALSLMLVEVASFRLSIGVDNGWILLGWFVVYVALWVAWLVGLLDWIRRGQLLSNKASHPS